MAFLSHLLFLLSSFSFLASFCHSADFSPPFALFLDCGSTVNTSIDDRTWLPDLSYLPSSPVSVASSTHAPPSLSSPFAPILLTSRIFPNSTSYSFTVPPSSRYWIRLYFFPFANSSYDLNSAVFSVRANGFELLTDLHVTSSIQNSNAEYLFKEFSVNVSSPDGALSLSFDPTAGSSYAFVNAIEIVSMPADLIQDQLTSLGSVSPEFVGMESTAVEFLHRVNVGGPFIGPGNDSAGIYRTWLANETFLYSDAGAQSISTASSAVVYPAALQTYFAPRSVYSTALEMEDTQIAGGSIFNISWVFPVDPFFVYVVRLHFCEIVATSPESRIFAVYLQNQTVFGNLDLVGKYGADNAHYDDFRLNTSDGASSLWVQIGPTPNAATSKNNAILNGIEIWKLNNSAGSFFNGATQLPENSSKRGMGAAVIWSVAAGSILLVALVSTTLFCILSRRKSKVHKQSSVVFLPLPTHGGNSASMGSKVSSTSQKSGTGSYVSSAPSSLGRFFTFAEIRIATSNFDEEQVLGVGGFGKVFKGVTDDGTKIAVKRGNPRSEQGATEFNTEIQLLSKLRHRHLVSLIGYCDENNEMILVYEYMAKGPLRSHLYGTDLPPLSWKRRLEICIGAARGLHYLHTGAAQGIIHRDVKTTNILLDENFVAKVSDFGLSRTGPTLDRSHVSTAVKGSFGYLDPEYFRRQQLTEKSDVYSFGVVLMEVLCARPAINPALPRDQVNIAEWAMQWQKMGLLHQIVDPHIAGTINRNSLRKYGETAQKCLAEHGVDRPTMGDVLWNLEYALQLQETAMASEAAEDESSNQILELPIRIPPQEHWDASEAGGGLSLNSMVSEEASEDAIRDSALFSQLVKPQGR